MLRSPSEARRANPDPQALQEQSDRRDPRVPMVRWVLLAHEARPVLQVLRDHKALRVLMAQLVLRVRLDLRVRRVQVVVAVRASRSRNYRYVVRAVMSCARSA